MSVDFWDVERTGRGDRAKCPVAGEPILQNPARRLAARGSR